MVFRGTMITMLLLAGLACNKTDRVAPSRSVTTDHPRILLQEGEEAAILNLISEDDTWHGLHVAILKECNKILGKSLLERKMIGRRLLGTSRECLKRVFYLSYAFRMTDDDRFLAKAKAEMLAAAAFSDWNPSHFLDVAEMTMALAIGYDWLYHNLSEEDRRTISTAIADKGLKPSYDDRHNWFLRSSHNWNQVCNAGMTFGAIAVEGDYPDLAKETIKRAINTIDLPMQDYEPDGAYPEGYGYWGYGTSFNVLFLSALGNFEEYGGVLTYPNGYLKTAEFLEHMLAPSGLCYNWGDCGLYGTLNPAMFWFAEKNQDPSLLWSEKQFLESTNLSRYTNNRLLPAALIWGKKIPLADISEPGATHWVGQGKNPIALMRTSWQDPNAIFLGFKAGSPSVNHGHMDIGSFVMESDGVRWAIDFGSQNYESLESKGLKIFGKDQDAQRWTIFRLNNFAHSTLTVDGALQRVDGYAKIDRDGARSDLQYAISDISAVYDGQLKQAMRGVAIRDGNHVVVQDEIETLDQSTLMRWNLVTGATATLGTNEITLAQDGRKLLIRISGPENIELKTWSTAPTNDYDAENPNTLMVGFECKIPAGTTERFEVLLLPQGAVDKAFMNKDLIAW